MARGVRHGDIMELLGDPDIWNPAGIFEFRGGETIDVKAPM